MLHFIVNIVAACLAMLFSALLGLLYCTGTLGHPRSWGKCAFILVCVVVPGIVLIWLSLATGRALFGSDSFMGIAAFAALSFLARHHAGRRWAPALEWIGVVCLVLPILGATGTYYFDDRPLKTVP